MIDRLSILAARLRRAVSRTRWSTRLLGHATRAEHSDEPGLLLVQIDGLSEPRLRAALASGRMPFLRHLIDREGYGLDSLYAGLPSATPCFQAELFYGVRNAFPAFAFRDPEMERIVSLSDPAVAAALERRLEELGSGLLAGGSSWSNVFTGGASEPHICASTVGLRTALGALAPRRVLGLVLWHLGSTVRVLGHLVSSTALTFYDLLRGNLTRHEIMTELRFVPVRVLVSTVMREIITVGASVDAERGLPVIHVNYLAYDEHAHRRGPDSRMARASLRGIDRAIRRVWMAAHRSPRRDYQVWIYSDHGQEATSPYEWRHGTSVEDAVRRTYDRLVMETVPDPPVPQRRRARAHVSETRFRWLGFEIPRWLGGNWIGREPGARAPVHPEAPVRATHQGPVGCVYLPNEHDAAFCRRLARSLTVEARIPIVLLPDGPHGALAFQGERRYRLPEEAAALLGREHPHLEWAAEDLVALAHHPAAGSMLLLGWRPGGALSLQQERGAHGGPGPHETAAFLMLPPEVSAAPRPRRLRPLDLRALIRDALTRGDGETMPEVRVPIVIARPDGESPDGGSHGGKPPGASGEGRGEDEMGPAGEAFVRVMTYNVHGCRGMDGKYAPQRIARVIARERPDIVCLQEVDERRTRSGHVDQAEVIAAQLRHEVQFHAVAELDDGRFGNAVLSLHPMRAVSAGALPAAARAKAFLSLWDRGALWVSVRVAGCELQVLNTHLSVLARERNLQVDALLGPAWLGDPRCTGPVVLAGDFNATPGSVVLRRLEGRLRSAVPPGEPAHTWSALLPFRQLDHVMVDRVAVRSVRVPNTRLTRVASDHLPLVVDLVLPARA